MARTGPHAEYFFFSEPEEGCFVGPSRADRPSAFRASHGVFSASPKNCASHAEPGISSVQDTLSAISVYFLFMGSVPEETGQLMNLVWVDNTCPA